MKKFFLLGIMGILSIFTMNAQNVGINSTGASPDVSAGLDVSYTDKGLLIPRVALTATDAAGPITSPVTSLLVYNTATAGSGATAVTPGFYYWNGSGWVRFAGGNGGVNCNNANYVIKSDGYNGTCSQIYDDGTNVGIGTTTPSYKLDVTSTIRAQDVFAAGGQNIIVGDDSYLSDVDAANTMGLYGTANTDRGGIKFGSGGATIFGYNNNIGVNTTSQAYTLDLNTGTFAFGNGNTRTQTRDNAGLQGDAGAQSGFFETESPTNYPAGASSWWHLIDVRHSNNGNNYAMQLAGSFFDQKLYFRKTNNNAAQAWSEVLTSSSVGDYAWKTLGNAGTTAGTNFIGTTDAVDFVVKTNNTEKLRVQSGGNVGIGTTAPGYPLTVTSATEPRTASFINTEANSDNYGVYGECASSDYYGFGGYFKGGWFGLYGTVSPTGSNYYYGVYGNVSGGSGTNYGVMGYAYSSVNTWNYGVYGSSTASNGTPIGVYGYVNKNNGFGVYGYNGNSSGTGILGIGNNIVSFYYPSNGGGIVGNGTTIGVLGYATNSGNNVWGGYFVAVNNSNQYAYVGGNNGGTSYKINGPGSVSTIVKRNDGTMANMFAPEAPEILFQDYGAGKLVNGKAHIDLDPIFAKNIVVNEKHPLRVFIQLEGDCNGVYVTNKTQNGFDVVELQNGQSNVNFSWTVVANRADEYDAKGELISKNADVRFPDGPGPLPTETLKIPEQEINPDEIEKGKNIQK